MSVVLKTDPAVIASYEYVGDELPAPGDIITARNTLAVPGPDGLIPVDELTVRVIDVAPHATALPISAKEDLED